MTKNNVLSAETGVYRYLELLRGGAMVTVYTKNKPSAAHTNEVAKLRKEPGTWGDWVVVSRPKTADPGLIPETWPGAHPGILSSRTLADTFTSNPDLWASVDE